MLASENNSKQLIRPQVHPRQTGVSSEAQLWATVIFFEICAVCFGAIIVWVMFLLKFIAMAAAHLAYRYLAVHKFCATDPNQDVESFTQLIERKIKFALGDAPPSLRSAKKLSFPL